MEENKQEVDLVTAVNTLARNNMILGEIMLSAYDALNELGKITSTYHRKILQGTATREDVLECSRITQRAMKHAKEMNRLRDYYQKVYKEPIGKWL